MRSVVGSRGRAALLGGVLIGGLALFVLRHRLRPLLARLGNGTTVRSVRSGH